MHRTAPGVEVHAETLSGDAVALLAKLAEEAALTVLGSSGQTMTPAVLLGSTVAELARRVATPLVVVRREPPCTGRPVVIGVDGSTGAHRAVHAGFEFAERAGAPVEAVHAWSDLPLDALGGQGAIDAVAARRDATELLDGQLAAARRRPPHVKARELVVLGGPTALLLARSVG